MKIIAEIGINHNGDFRLIQELVRQAAAGGADYAKFQLYSSQRVFGDDSRSRNEFTFQQVHDIRQMCQFYNIGFLASVFDEEKIDWCEQLGVDSYKIASRTVVKEPELCQRVLAIGKPTFVSLGCWSDEELPFARYGNVGYFNCIFKYPTTCVDYQAPRPYEGPVLGVSDHSYGIGYCLYNIAQGAQYVEKHFTLNKTMPGNDHIGSMDLAELAALRQYGNEIAAVRAAIAAPPLRLGKVSPPRSAA